MSKAFLLLSFSLTLVVSYGQTHQWNSQKGFIAQGYDVVSYFDNKPQEGNDKFMAEHGTAKFKFSSKENKDKFVADPEKYSPQYGGYCAYALAKKGEKIKINPKAFDVREGKLYLFYKAYFNNALEKWLEEGPEKLKPKADANWSKLNKK